MATYKAGIRTRNSILQSAKQLFYENGYNSVNVVDICKAAGIKLGTFTYHFKTKEQLIRYIYDDYINRIWAYTESELQTDDAPRVHMYAIALYYFNIYNDPHITFFHHEMFLHFSMNDIFIQMPPRTNCFVKTEDSILSEPHIYENLIIADNGSRRELNLRFMERHTQPNLEDILELIRDIYFVTSRLLSFPQKQMDSYIDESREFVLSHLDSGIHLIP